MRLRWFPSPDYSWRDLVVFVKHLPQNSAYVRESLGGDSAWDLNNQLNALIADYLRILVWFKTKDGSKGRNFPKPIPRPGVEDGTKKRIGKGTKIKAADMAAILGMG